MKIHFFALVLSFGVTQVVFSQAQQQQVTNIDKAKQEINNNLGNYQKIEEREDSTGYSYVYLNNKELKLKTIYIKDENIDKHVEWYFLNGQQIYGEQLWTDTKTSKVTENEKCYFSAGHLIYWIENDKQVVDTASQKFKNADSELVAYGVKLEAWYASKSK